MMLQVMQRHAEESASAAQQIRALQQQLAEEQSAKETEQQVRERAEQQVAELKVHACSSLQSSVDRFPVLVLYLVRQEQPIMKDYPCIVAMPIRGS